MITYCNISYYWYIILIISSSKLGPPNVENVRARLAWSDSSCGLILTYADLLEHVVAEKNVSCLFLLSRQHSVIMTLIILVIGSWCCSKCWSIGKFGTIFELHVVSQSSLVMADDPTCTEPTWPMIKRGDNPGQNTLMIPLALVTLVRSSSRCSCGEVEGPAGGLALSWDLSQKNIP